MVLMRKIPIDMIDTELNAPNIVVPKRLPVAAYEGNNSTSETGFG
jgi:hypothetical protein